MNGKRKWPLERALFAVAGSVTLISAVLAVALSKWFALLAGVVGISQWLYVLAGWCPVSVILRRTCRLQSAIYVERNPAQDVAPRVGAR